MIMLWPLGLLVIWAAVWHPQHTTASHPLSHTIQGSNSCYSPGLHDAQAKDLWNTHTYLMSCCSFPMDMLHRCRLMTTHSCSGTGQHCMMRRCRQSRPRLLCVCAAQAVSHTSGSCPSVWSTVSTLHKTKKQTLGRSQLKSPIYTNLSEICYIPRCSGTYFRRTLNGFCWNQGALN